MTAKTIALVSQKGGVGKSTTVINLAVLAADAGLRVHVIDLDDTQRTAADWLDGRREAGIGQAIGVTRASAPDLPRVMATARQLYDVIVIDTKASADGPAMAALKAADMVLMPTRPDALFDLAALQTTVTMATQEQKPAAVLFTLVSPRRMELADETRKGMEGQGVVVCPHQIADRAAVKDATGLGLALHEHSPRDRAAKEMNALFAWTMAQVGLTVSLPETKKARKAAA